MSNNTYFIPCLSDTLHPQQILGKCGNEVTEVARQMQLV